MATDEVLGARVDLDDNTQAGSSSADANLQSLFSSYMDLSTIVKDVAGLMKSAWSAGMEATKAASAQESAQVKLRAALISTGQYSQETESHILSMAAAMQRQIGVGDEVILQTQTMALSLGASTDQLRDMTLASAGAAAAGLNQDTVMRGLATSLGGNVSMLSRYVPQLRELTEEQLRDGEAIRMMREQFGGLAGTEMQTLAGRVTDLSNAWGDTQEVIGGVVTESANLQAVTTKITDLVVDLNAELERQQGAYISVVDGGVIVFVDGVELAIFSVGKFREATDLSGAAFQAWWETILRGAAGVVEALAFVEERAIGLPAKLLGLQDDIAVFFDDTAASLRGQADALGESSAAQIENAAAIQEGTQGAIDTVEQWKLGVLGLADELRNTAGPADQAGAAYGRVGDEADEAAGDVKKLADEVVTLNSILQEIEYGELAQRNVEAWEVMNQGPARAAMSLAEINDLMEAHIAEQMEMAEQSKASMTGIASDTQSLIQGATGQAMQMFGSLGQSLLALDQASDSSAKKQKQTWKDVTKQVISSIAQQAAMTLAAKAVEAFAGVVAGESSKGIPGMIAGLAAGAVVMGIIGGLASQIPTAAQGGVAGLPQLPGGGSRPGDGSRRDNMLIQVHEGEGMLPASLRLALLEALNRPAGRPAQFPAPPTPTQRRPVDVRGQQGAGGGDVHVHVDTLQPDADQRRRLGRDVAAEVTATQRGRKVRMR